MTFTERINEVVRWFQFRSIPDGRFRPAPARDTERPIRGEVAYADPRRLFPGSEKYRTFNPSTLVGMRGLQLFDEMRRDDQVKAALAFKKHACIATGWTVTSPEGKSKDWEPTRFARWVLENMDPHEIGSTTLDGDLYEILGALDYGFSVSEKIYSEITEGPFRGHVGLRSLKTRSPHHISFAQDVYGNLAADGVVQPSNPYNNGRLPRDKFVLFTYQSQFGNPYGTSDLEAAYFPWWLKHNAQKWLAMLLERFGIPPIFGLYNPSRYAADRNLLEEIKRIFTNLQAATSAILPRPDKDALEFWSPSDLSAPATRVFIPALEYMNAAISRAVLMPSLLGMTSDTSQGSYARSRIHFDVFLLVVESIRKDLELVAMNHQVLRPLLDINFPGLQVYPAWRFLPLTDDLRLELLRQWGELVTGAVVTPQADDEIHIRKMMQFPEKKVDTEIPRVVPGVAPAANGTDPQPTNGRPAATPRGAGARSARREDETD
jgi:hypothetical protein